MAVYKTEYYDSNNIFMVPLVCNMHAQICNAINELHCNMHILLKFQIWWKFWWDRPRKCVSGIVTSNAFATVPTMAASLQAGI